MLSRKSLVFLHTLALALLIDTPSRAQITAVTLDYDRIQLAENFLREIYPDLKPEGLLITYQTAFGLTGTSWSYVAVTRCRPGYSGVPAGGYPPKLSVDPPSCPGPMQVDASGYLMAEIELVRSKPHLRGFGAQGKFVDEKLESLHQDLTKHPDWGEKEILQALADMSPQFGPEHKDAFVKAIPVQIVERFSGCVLSRQSATFFAKRLSLVPDTEMQLGWTVFGTSRDHGRPNCSATFEPFEGKLLTIAR